MSRNTFDQCVKNLFHRRQKSRSRRSLNRNLSFERLDERIVLSVTATFTPTTDILSVLGDQLANSIVVSRDAAGQILINGGTVAVAPGRFIELVQYARLSDATPPDEGDGVPASAAELATGHAEKLC